jgi:XrtJ-associated TM-motif-TM protein
MGRAIWVRGLEEGGLTAVSGAVGLDLEALLRSNKLMSKSSFVLIAAAVLFVIAVPVQAQTGCSDSPENPTAVLALVGSAGALFSTVRARMRARRKSSKR